MENLLQLLTLISFLTGLCFGSFLNVIIYRVPQKKSIIYPPSSCPGCSKRLGFTELIPIIGYILLRGRCRHCNIDISVRYPLVELVTGIVFAFTLYHFSFSLDGFFYLALIFLLLAVALIDFEHRIVPNSLVIVGLTFGLLFFLPAAVSFIFNVPTWLIVERSLLDAGAGFLLGGLVMLIIILVSRGGMGAGDMKLMAMIGLFVGLRGTALVMLLGFLMGAIIGVAYMIAGRLTRKDALPFAPFLSLAAFIQIFWGDYIWDWYINLL